MSMTRDQIVTHFIELSGRYDLVTDAMGSDYSNASPLGVDFFINGGVKWLENRVERRKEIVTERVDVVADQVLQSFDNVKSFKEAWMSNADGRFLLVKKSLGWIRENYGAASGIDNAKPKYWAPAAFGFSQNQNDLTAVGGASPYTDEFTYDIDDHSYGDHYNKGGIIWMPPADTTYTLTIYAHFFEKKLTAASDVNFWSSQFEEILITAALMMLERFYRNTEGVNDYKRELLDDLRTVGFEVIEEEISGVNQMQG